MTQSPFHAGELEVQARAGVQAAGGAIRDFMPEQHRAFFGLLPFLPVATTDQDGWPVATILTGRPGFIASPDPGSLHIATLPDAADPVRPYLASGAQVGVLGIDLGTRRRNRANGVIASTGADGILISVHQSFGNCPQYIQVRDVRPADSWPGVPEPIEGLDGPARTWIGQADTFFVASGSGSVTGPAGGVDISHRGGTAGFVHVDGDTLTIPDYRGNRYFNTLGNLLLDPRAALLFVDFGSGDLLHVQGEVEILWESGGTWGFEGAERLWRLRVARAWRRKGALPLRWFTRIGDAGG
ncbi:pyridoxamine 5'-phosphate oxidase family protein [Microvirga sp. GCM10011540]|uniref:pyridoxamine 5'-phosphate oxidase family protein n=1 Tax=Microvirga sp. GCM10011540 TaxID=3317338 RepID=UPI0036222671